MLVVALAATLSACSTTSGVPVEDLFTSTLREARKGKAAHPETPNHQSGSQAGRRNLAGDFSGVVVEGTDRFVSPHRPVLQAAKTTDGKDGYTLNLLNAPVAAAAKAVMGDTLGVNYTIDSRITGTISIQTSTAVDRDSLVDLFETALAVNGAAIVRHGNGYQIVPSNEALSVTPAISVSNATRGSPGIAVQVIELQYIDAAEMQTILAPITRSGSILRIDQKRNQIVLAGTASDLRSIREAISVFDVDWMQGQSVALHPLQNSTPTELVEELNTIFGSDAGSGVVRFIPNERLNSILVVTSRSKYLARAADWINRLDRRAASAESQLFVYDIQHRSAAELASVLQSVLSGERGAIGTHSRNVAPDLSAVTISNTQPNASSDRASSGSSVNPAASDLPYVVADLEKNALLISTTAEEYARIERILHQLDVAPKQVLLEAVIAEVRLNDELKFGLRWAVESGQFRLNLSDVATGFAGAAFPGASFAYVTDNINVTLNALASITDVEIISSPNILALSNQKALLQVGDQVPIVTQQATSTTTGSAPVINSVELKDTGIILTVLPRVNSNGRVLLDIEQEVSNVVATTTSGIDSPTIQQRKIATKVLVGDGEALALGGLIQEQNSLERGQVPIVGDIPVIGNLFKNKTDTIRRTELVIFIRPRVVHNIHEAREITEEFRSRLDSSPALRRRRAGETELQRDINRLKY